MRSSQSSSVRNASYASNRIVGRRRLRRPEGVVTRASRASESKAAYDDARKVVSVGQPHGGYAVDAREKQSSPRQDARVIESPPSSSSLAWGGRQKNGAMPLKLLTGYGEVVNALCAELARTGAGDVVDFSVYVFEKGESSQRVMEAMKRAVRRGVKVRCTVDGSPVSKFTRWCEGSTTLTSELENLQRDFGSDRFTFTAVKQATHAKWMVVERKNGTGLPSAIFGGVNVGDRFSNWRDFAIRAEGRDVVDAMRQAVSMDPSSTKLASIADIVFASNLPTGFCPLAWAFPRYLTYPGRFDVKTSIVNLLSDPKYSRYYVAMAYVDSVGADMLARVLERPGTSLKVIVPRNPNVYHDANRKALVRLIEKTRARGQNLRILLIDDMLHAKVFFAESDLDNVQDIAMMGSCNLKQRSLGQFVELNALIRQPALTVALRRQLEFIMKDSQTANMDDLRFSEPKATIEEWLG